MFIPAFTGLGAPQWNPDIRASFYGITRDSSKKDFVTAAFNSLCYQTKEVLDAISDDGLNIKEMYIDGGMANNKTFAQLLANITDTNISIPKNTEATAIGAAKVAAVGCGLVKNIEFFNTLKKESKFNANQHTDYLSDFTFWKQYLDESILTPVDAKTKLQEYSLKKYKELPTYTFFKKTGPQHRPLFKTNVQIPNSKKTIGHGLSKKNAQQDAATKLLKSLKIL